MKTIKELEAEKDKTNEMSTKTFYFGRIESLKDVLELIDEYSKQRIYRSKDCQLLIKMIKAKIKG